MNTVRRPRRLALAVASLGLALTATGCSYFNPVQTHDFYQAADGTNATITRDGQQYAGVRNAILVVEEPGSAVLYATAVNYSSNEVQVELEGTKDDTSIFRTTVTVPAGEAVKIGPDEAQSVTVDEDVPTSDIIDMTVTVEGESQVISLPVGDTSLEYYERSDGGGEG